MSGDLHKVRTGEPLRIPARAYNAFVDAAHLARRIDADTGARDGEIWFELEAVVDVPGGVRHADAVRCPDLLELHDPSVLDMI